jgi:hypothetical protein
MRCACGAPEPRDCAGRRDATRRASHSRSLVPAMRSSESVAAPSAGARRARPSGMRESESTPRAGTISGLARARAAEVASREGTQFPGGSITGKALGHPSYQGIGSRAAELAFRHRMAGRGRARYRRRAPGARVSHRMPDGDTGCRRRPVSWTRFSRPLRENAPRSEFPLRSMFPDRWCSRGPPR